MGDLQGRLQNRLGELRQELEVGETRLQELEREMVVVQQTMLRIRGAIQVLTELDEPPDGPDARTADPPLGESAAAGNGVGER